MSSRASPSWPLRLCLWRAGQHSLSTAPTVEGTNGDPGRLGRSEIGGHAVSPAKPTANAMAAVGRRRKGRDTKRRVGFFWMLIPDEPNKKKKPARVTPRRTPVSGALLQGGSGNTHAQHAQRAEPLDGQSPGLRIPRAVRGPVAGPPGAKRMRVGRGRRSSGVQLGGVVGVGCRGGLSGRRRPGHRQAP